MNNIPQLFRKKPVVIEAMQLTGDTAQWHAVYSWIENNTLGSFEPLNVIEGRVPYPASGVSIDPRDGRLIISTLEGLHWADPGDWIIRGVEGEFYPCKPSIFEATYESVEAVSDSIDPDMLARAWDEGAAAAWERSTAAVNGERYYWRSAGEPLNPYRQEIPHV